MLGRIQFSPKRENAYTSIPSSSSGGSSSLQRRQRPLVRNSNDVRKRSYKNYGDFGKSIFDPLSIGWYFFGPDPFHIKANRKNPWGEIDYTKYEYEWIEDEKGRKRPYFIINDEKILINNLHIHSKNLKAGLSK